MENQTTNQEQTNPSTIAYCKNCGAMLSPDLQECPMCGADLENTLPTKTHNGLRKSRIIIFILVTILVITGIVLFTHRNVIMGNIKCKSGDYSAAVQYYEKEVADGGGSQNVKNTYSALTNYLEALDAYARDDMETLSNYLENLTTITSKYPTPEEIKTLSNQYTTRNNEIISYDKSIEEIVKLFADVSKIDEIQNKCNELLQKNVTDVQTNKINDIKTNATNYTNIMD